MGLNVELFNELVSKFRLLIFLNHQGYLHIISLYKDDFTEIVNTYQIKEIKGN